MPHEIHYKTNTGTENTPTQGMERLFIYVGRIYGEKVWKWIQSVLDQERKNTITDQIEFTNRDAVIRDSGFNVLAHTFGGCLNYLPNYLLSYAQQ